MKIKYEAKNGKIFDTEEECKEYEIRLEEYESIKNDICEWIKANLPDDKLTLNEIVNFILIHWRTFKRRIEG